MERQPISQMPIFYNNFNYFRSFDNSVLSQSVKYMQKYHGNEYELKISRIKMADKGVYTVTAENSFGRKEEHATLKVEGMISATKLDTMIE